MFRRTSAILILLCSGLFLAGCGYRAPMHASYVPEVTDSSRYAGVRPEYQELAALMEKDVDMRPTQGNTVTLIADGQENWELLKDEFRKAKKSIYVEPYRFRLDTCGTLLAGILAARAAEGIDVRIILDKSANTNEDRAALKGRLYRELLRGAGVDEKRIGAILRVTDLDGMTVRDGRLEEEERLTADIRREGADFIGVTKTRGALVETPPAAGRPARTRAEIEAIRDGGERRRAIAENAALFGLEVAD